MGNSGFTPGDQDGPSLHWTPPCGLAALPLAGSVTAFYKERLHPHLWPEGASARSQKRHSTTSILEAPVS